mgnify:CR=1 FL=1
MKYLAYFFLALVQACFIQAAAACKSVRRENVEEEVEEEEGAFVECSP